MAAQFLRDCAHRAPRRRRYDHLNELVKTTEGMPSSGMVKRIIARRGVLCQVCWRRRWFRAEVMRVYPTSLLFKWHDWSDSDWCAARPPPRHHCRRHRHRVSPPPPPHRPHFFVRLALPDTNGSEPLPEDECWRVRWHKTSRTRDLPVVEPKFGTMPAIVWVKAFLRTYAVAESQQMLQEVYDNLPPQYHSSKRSRATASSCWATWASARRR